ncbi:TetR/AcrR family transcriptional regulator [Nocardioides sp. TF02-7]|uniref:TetR/AcrR family transcriptional regulator n=1 Tax=Nocardioides sp. TF02-7 TaxID=2917724 RepID=UPI001F0523F7|nr:TetR/AcrR family transcriptional regulator [Nocardioides sp. TF02-7]UMG91184.1 TetR/AcrR family transcriptional regulator [Nocardioides sp. TF02-7]
MPDDRLTRAALIAEGGAGGSLRADARRNRERVVLAALEIFAEDGRIDSMEQVAERAGVAKGTVYRSFPNRAALVTAVAAHQFAEIQEIADTALAGEGEPTAAFVRLVHEIFQYNGANGLFVEALRHDDLTEEVRTIQHRMRLSIALAMDRCRPEGSISPDITPDDLFVVMAGVSLQLNKDRGTPDEWRRGADLVLRSLGVPRSFREIAQDSPS